MTSHPPTVRQWLRSQRYQGRASERDGTAVLLASALVALALAGLAAVLSKLPL
jgi:hypothetical protein